MMWVDIGCLAYLCLWITSCSSSSSSGYPDLSTDYTLSEAPLEPLYREYIDNHRGLTDGMPKVCRIDICYPKTESQEGKGDFHWPEVNSGQQVHLRCPYSFDRPVYTARSCTVDAYGKGLWDEVTEYWTACPESPVVQVLDRIPDELEEYMGQHHDLIKFYDRAMERVLEAFTIYNDIPLTMRNVDHVTLFLFNALNTFLYLDTPQKNNLTEKFINVIDFLLEDNTRLFFETSIYSFSHPPRFGHQLITLLLKTNSQDDNIRVMRNHIALYKFPVQYGDNYTTVVEEGFDIQVNDNLTVKSPRLSVRVNQNSDDTNGVVLAALILEHAEVLTRVVRWWEFDTQTYAVPDFVFRNFTIYNETFQNETTQTEVSQFYTLGNLILLESTDRFITEDIDVSFSYHTCDVSVEGHNCTKLQPVCVKSGFGGALSSIGCEVINKMDEDGFTSCQCWGEQGYYAVFVEGEREGPDPVGQPGLTPVITGDISAFLGFPYRKELELLGTVLGSISLFFLLITIGTFTQFRKITKGVPTTILLNLCTALVVLSVLLLMVQYLDAMMTRTGCTWSNGLRYYLVFVSLLWNGVEGFTMYLMLLKVYNSNIQKFARKAGLLAWGLPLLMVVICRAVNNKAFNGHFIILSEQNGECAFKCQLHPEMLYYAYLIPLGTIILHNLIVLAFVYRAVIRNAKKLGKSQTQSKMINLGGALGTLVLLGIPWILSAFGIIDATNNEKLAKTEGTFQVFFVVFVNLQGLFIFVFYCARNAKLRESWSSLLRSSLSTSSSSGNNQERNDQKLGEKGLPERELPGVSYINTNVSMETKMSPLENLPLPDHTTEE